MTQLKAKIANRFPHLLKIQPSNLLMALQYKRSPQDFVALNWVKTDNVGDELNDFVVRRLTGRCPLPVPRLVIPRPEKMYSLIGSTLGFWNQEGSIIWGTGFRTAQDTLVGNPSAILALRGPLSASRLKSSTSEEITFGDPAILMPDLLPASRKPNGSIGLIPHFRDLKQVSDVVPLAKDRNVRLLSVHQNVHHFIESLNSCDAVLTSSLHGAILADAYKIPNILFRGVESVGETFFKFADYYSGVGANIPKVFDLQEGIQRLDEVASITPIESSTIFKLRSSCPFQWPALAAECPDS